MDSTRTVVDGRGSCPTCGSARTAPLVYTYGNHRSRARHSASRRRHCSPSEDGLDIHNADRVVSAWQRLEVGDKIRLTPDPYLGQPGQLMTVAEIQPERALVLRQTLPNGSPASWAFLLRTEGRGRTRILMRRRGGGPTLFDRVMAPGYALMDRGMLHGLRQRAEGDQSHEARTRSFLTDVHRAEP